MKNPKTKYRNPATIPAKSRTSAGPMINKTDKRTNGSNSFEDFMKEIEEEAEAAGADAVEELQNLRDYYKKEAEILLQKLRIKNDE